MAVRTQQLKRASGLILVCQYPSVRSHSCTVSTLAEASSVSVTISALVVCLQNVKIRAPTFGALDMLGENVEGADLGHVISLLLPGLPAQRLDYARRTFKTAELNLAVSET
jgi:hypothetical protein